MTQRTIELAEALTKIFGSHLPDQDIDPDDDFYALGGDSLIALRVVAAAREQGIDMTLRDLLFHPTVRSLAGHLATAAPAGATDGPRSSLLGASDRALVPAGVRRALPASALQVGMVYLCEVSGDPALYHSVVGWEVVAPFDEERFRAALADLCDRHPALRTSLDLGAFSEPVQLQWERIDLPLLVERESTGAHLPIDWTRPPLFRVHVEPRPDSFRVSFATHHAILDGWSYGQLIADLMALYGGRVRGQSVELPELPAHADEEFVATERELGRSGEAAEFWHRQADAPPLLFGHRQFGGAADACESVEFPLDDELVSGLRAAARAAGVSTKALALAAHVRALAAWTGRTDDIVTGVVVNTRPGSAGSDRLVGLYLNTVPIRFDSVDGPAPALARRALAVERDAAPYLAYPAALIESRLGRAPYDAVFNYMNFHVYADIESAAGLATRSWWVRGKPSFPFRVDFELDGVEAGSQVLIAYDPALLDRDRVEAFARLYSRALAWSAGAAA